jgi:hypothetical protein
MDEQTNPQPISDNDPPQSDDANLRELTLALITARYPDATDSADEVEPQLLPGQLPPGFPSDFPLPPGSRVVGALVATRPIIVLDTDQSGEAVIAFYTERLTAAGWSAPEGMPSRHGGFLHSSDGAFGRTYALFFRDDGPALQVMTLTTASRRTIILISQMPEGVRPMRHGHRSRMKHRDIFSILPPIAPPPHARQFQEGGGGGDDHVTTSARVESDLDVSALATHYIAQLERGGWQRTESGENGPVAWSTWTFESEEKEPWRALFVILKRPDVAQHYWVDLLAEWAGEQPQGGTKVVSSVTSWLSYGPITRIPT